MRRLVALLIALLLTAGLARADQAELAPGSAPSGLLSLSADSAETSDGTAGADHTSVTEDTSVAGSASGSEDASVDGSTSDSEDVSVAGSTSGTEDTSVAGRASVSEGAAVADGTADAVGAIDAEPTPAGTAEADTTDAEPYEVTTLLVTARFASRPRISTYNYLLGDSVCRLAVYEYTKDDTRAYVITLTFSEELAQALDGASYEDSESMLRMAMDALESLGFIAVSSGNVELYGRPCTLLSVYGEDADMTGWATINSREVVYILATGDDAGYEFLGTVASREQAEFTQDGYEVSFQGATLNFPYSVDVQGSEAVSRNARSYAYAELIQLPDLAVLAGVSGEDADELLYACVPEGAVDVSTQTLGDARTMLYSRDDAQLGEPVQGRLILLDGYVLRMEATFDNAGDAFMDGVYLE